MTAWFIIAAALLALALAPVHIDAAYESGIFTLTGRAGPVPVKLFPREKATAGELEKDARRDAKSLFRRLPMPVLGLLAESGCRTFGRLVRHVRVRALRARYVAGGPDPCRAAMAYARAGLAMEGAVRLVPNAQLLAEIDLDGGKSSFAGDISLGARLWAVLWAAGCFGTDFLRGYFRYKREKD